MVAILILFRLNEGFYLFDHRMLVWLVADWFNHSFSSLSYSLYYLPTHIPKTPNSHHPRWVTMSPPIPLYAGKFSCQVAL